MKTNKTSKSKSKKNNEVAAPTLTVAGRDVFGNSTGRSRSHLINQVVLQLCTREQGATCTELQNAFRDLAKSLDMFSADGADVTKAITEKTVLSTRRHLDFLKTKNAIVQEGRIYKVNATYLTTSIETMQASVKAAQNASETK